MNVIEAQITQQEINARKKEIGTCGKTDPFKYQGMILNKYRINNTS